MAKAQKAVRIGADVRRRQDNVERLQAAGKLEKVQARRLVRLQRNHPDKAGR